MSDDHKLVLELAEDIVLEEIVKLEGDCLKRERCEKCPFRTQCLPEFLVTPKLPPTKNQRLQMALDSIARNIVLGDEENTSWKR